MQYAYIPHMVMRICEMSNDALTDAADYVHSCLTTQVIRVQHRALSVRTATTFGRLDLYIYKLTNK